MIHLLANRAIHQVSQILQMFSQPAGNAANQHTDAFPLNSQDMEQDLAAMANDLDIQAEIAAINEEFAVAEMDGLEKL